MRARAGIELPIAERAPLAQRVHSPRSPRTSLRGAGRLALVLLIALGGRAAAQSLVDEAQSAGAREGTARGVERESSGGLDVIEGFLDGNETGTGFGEDYLLGVPRGLAPAAARPLLLAWHGFGAPPRQIFRDTDYPAECASRGWFLLAPRGLDDKSFAFPPAQRNVRALLAHVLASYPIDRARLYAVGWSMGAQSALCFAARHREDEIARFAAVAALQGPHDVLDTYRNESEPLRAWLVRLFGATPEADVRPYLRTSSVRLDERGEFLAREPSYAWHLVDLPLLLVHAPDDSLRYLRAQNLALGAFLRSRGAPVVEWSVRGRVPAHDWRIAGAGSVCDFLARHRAGPAPRRFALVSDGEAARGGVRLEPRTGAAFATAEVWREGARWRIASLRHAEVVELALDALDASEPCLEVALRSGSGSVERLRVRGLARAPLELRRGRRRIAAHDWSIEEGLLLDARTAPARWTIRTAER